MAQLIEDPAGPGGNAEPFTVSEISGAVKRAVEGGFSHIRVRGELGRVSRPRSGHVYLDLKDDRAVLAGVVWKGQAARLSTQPEEGLEVIATGRLTTFAGQSKYQIVIEDLAPAGMGALMAMLAKRQAALAAEGLFDAARKRPLPFLPAVIGVVTSPSGAVIRDILHRLADRFPVPVLVWPVAVQGERSAGEVARAIAGFDALPHGGAVPRPELIIVARGGGSLEDLWGFNDEAVVRAAAACSIPLISAVGHETDTTLIDHAADARAPTPSAAAEMAVPVRAELLAWAEGQGARLTAAQARGLQARGQRLRDLARALPRPGELTRPAAQRLDWWSERLPRAAQGYAAERRRGLQAAAGALRLAHPGAALRERRHALALAARDLSRTAGLAVASGHRRLGGRSASLPRGRTVLAPPAGRLDRAAGRLSLNAAARQAALARTALSQVRRLLDVRMRVALADRSRRLAALDRLRRSLGYEATLERGFAVIRAGGAVVTERARAASAASLEVQFRDGRLDVRPQDAPAQEPGARTAPSAAPRRRRPKPAQRSLFED